MSKAKLVAITTAVITVLAAASEADAAVCRARISGTGTGNGLFGGATLAARAAATAEWQAKVGNRHGSRFTSMDKAQSVRWDCTQTPIVQAKCVVTARPCR